MEEYQKQIPSKVLFELTTLTKSSFNYQQGVKLILDKLSQVLDYTVATLFLVNEGEIIANVKHNSSRKFLLETKKLTLKKLNELTQEKTDLDQIKSIVYEDPKALCEKTSACDKLTSHIVSPLIIRDQTKGIILLSSNKDILFSKEDQSILDLFSGHAAIILDNIILYAHAEQRMIEMSVLHEVAKTLSSILNLDQLLHLIVVKSAELVKAERVSLMFKKDGTKTLTIKTAVGVNSEIIENTEQEIGSGIAGLVADSGEGITVSDIEEDVNLKNMKSGATYKKGSFICLPISIRNEVVGVLNVTEKTSQDHFNEEDAELLDTFLNQAATAIENAILYYNMEQLAVTDGLTMVYNHRYFQERLEKEMRRARRYDLHLSLMMLDVDYFKKYNDTYGHPKGDMVLKKISDILKATVRDIDIIARYGGEEFVIVLPETTHRDSQHIAERIRSTVASHGFPGRTDDETTHITVSIGLTTFPSSKATSRPEVIDQADKALYRAKDGGRNQVCAVEID